MSHVADDMHAGSPASGLLVAIAVVADIDVLSRLAVAAPLSRSSVHHAGACSIASSLSAAKVCRPSRTEISRHTRVPRTLLP